MIENDGGQVEAFDMQKVIQMKEDVNLKKSENILESLKKKEESLAGSIGNVCNSLEKKIQKLNALKEEERENKSKSSKDQIDKLKFEVSVLTAQFAGWLDQLTKKEMYAYRIALISIYKSSMHWLDQKNLDQLLVKYDEKNGFKKLCDKNLFLKLECTNPQLFNRCKECLENPIYETVVSVSNTIVYGNLDSFSSSEKLSLLTDFVKQVYSEDDVIQKKIIAEVQDRPTKSMNVLRNLDKNLYKKFLSLNLPEHFYRAHFVKEGIRKYTVNKQVKDELIADIDKRFSKFEPSEIALACSMRKLKAEDDDLYNKFTNSEDSPDWKEEVTKVRKLIKEKQFDQAIKEVIEKDITLTTEELRNIMLKSLEDPDSSPLPNEPINSEKRKGEEKLIACFLYSHYKVLEKQQQKDSTKKQTFNDKLQEINSKFLDTLEKIKNDQQIPLEMKQELIEQLNKRKTLIETCQTTAQNKFGQSKDKSFYFELKNTIFADKNVSSTMKNDLLNNLEQHIIFSSQQAAFERLDTYEQQLHDIQKIREEILNYQAFPPKSELAKEIVQLLMSNKFPDYFKKIHENGLNLLELREQVKNDRNLPVDKKQELVQRLSKIIIDDREAGYQKELLLYSSNVEKLREIQEEISNDRELPEATKSILKKQVMEMCCKARYNELENKIFKKTDNFSKLGYEIKDDNILSEKDKGKLRTMLDRREVLMNRALLNKIPSMDNKQQNVRRKMSLEEKIQNISNIEKINEKPQTCSRKTEKYIEI